MFHNRTPIKYQAGLGLPSALFLILVLVLLIATMNQLNEVNSTAFGREWLSLRAFYSAESAAQVAAVAILNPEQTMNSCDDNFIVNQAFTQQGLASCLANVSCEQQVVDGNTYYTLTSMGSCGSDIDQARRVIQIRIAP